MQSNQDNMPRSERPPKKEKVLLKLSTTKKIELPLAQHPSEIAEPLVIAITCGTRCTQLVISRPIGVTKYDKKTDWVITPIEEVETAIAFAEDPSKGRKAAAKQKLRTDALIASGEYIMRDGKMYQKDQKIWPKDIATMNAEWNTAFNDARRIAKEQYLADCEAANQKPKRDWKYGMDLNHFIPKELRDHEALLDKNLEQNLSYLEGLKELNNYETLVGANRDQRQRKLVLAEELSPEQLVDVIKKKLIHVLTFPPPAPKVSVEEKTKAGNNSAKASTPPPQKGG